MDRVLDAPAPPADDDNELTAEEIRLARRTVAGFLATRSPLPVYDAEDLVQECLEHWLRRRDRYDASRGATSQTFMRRVLERHLLDHERTQTAEKRGGGDPAVSLDLEDDDQASLHDLVPGREDTERAALWALAFDRARARLTEPALELLGELTTGRSMTEISRHAARARSSLYRDLERIREAFQEEGLDEFLR